MKRVFTLLLAGGEGRRLLPSTLYRAKPAVPFGGSYRLIDFTLSNCVNSGVRRIGVLLHTKSTSLNRHLHLAWNVYRPELGDYIGAIIDKGVAIPPGTVIGFDPAADQERFFVSPDGIVVIPKFSTIAAESGGL